MSGTKGNSREPVAQSFRTFAEQAEKLPPCQAQCPNSGDIRGWLGVIAQHEKNGLSLDEAYDRAWAMIAELNPLPATIARICPHPCEDLCTRSDKDDAVSINAVERFLGDWAISRSLDLPSSPTQHFAESVGVIGSGPASLSFAYQMARLGYRVTLYERRKVPGGMLRHAIPDYRLPRDVLDTEIERLLSLGISLQTDTDIGGETSLEKLRDQHDAIFLGLGAQAARHLDIPGENGPGVITGIDYLRQRKKHAPLLTGKRVLVIGGGNTAIDAARSARREGADVMLLYRRSEAEMPAIADEVEDARMEGVEFRFLVSPIRIVRDGKQIRCVELQTMRLGNPDSEGRRSPLPVEGGIEEIPADTVIVAVSQAPDWHGMDGISVGQGWLHTEADGRLDERIWAGGDDRGPGIAGRAIAQGRAAAESAHATLRGRLPRDETTTRKVVREDSVRTDYYAGHQRNARHRLLPVERLSHPDAEIDETLTYEEASDEAARCMSCGLCFDCQQCFMYCNAAGFTRIEETHPGSYFVMALDACEGCGKCIELCPCGFLDTRDETRDAFGC